MLLGKFSTAPLVSQDIHTRRALWTALGDKLSSGLVYGALLVGPLIGVAWGLGNGLRLGLSTWLLIGLFSGLFLGLLAWLQSIPYDKGLFFSPNAGAWQSLWIGLYTGLVYGMTFGLILGLFWEIANPNVSSPNWLDVALGTTVFIGMILGLADGGDAFLRHLLLRFWLWRADQLPWNLMVFLDEADCCILVNKAERGYCFIHDLFREYLASLGTLTPTSSIP